MKHIALSVDINSNDFSKLQHSIDNQQLIIIRYVRNPKLVLGLSTINVFFLTEQIEKVYEIYGINLKYTKYNLMFNRTASQQRCTPDIFVFI